MALTKVCKYLNVNKDICGNDCRYILHDEFLETYNGITLLE